MPRFAPVSGAPRLPRGYRLRAALDEDLQAITRLRQAVDLARHGETDSSEAEIAEEWALPRLDREHDVWVVEGPDKGIVGYGLFWVESPPHEAFAGHTVDPGHRGRGLTEALLGLAERRAAELAARNDDDRPVSLTVDTDAGDAADVELFARRGFVRAREFLDMQVVFSGPPSPPVWPAGVAVRRFCWGRDEAAVWAATDEAFRDHYRPSSMDLEEWTRLRKSRPDLDVDLWWIAWDGEQAVGEVLAFHVPSGAYIDSLAVRRRWRGRGLGRALLLQVFARLHERGARRAHLGVDSINPTGAVRLYESVGMRPTRRYRVFEKDVPAGRTGLRQ